MIHWPPHKSALHNYYHPLDRTLCTCQVIEVMVHRSYVHTAELCFSRSVKSRNKRTYHVLRHAYHIATSISVCSPSYLVVAFNISQLGTSAALRRSGVDDHCNLQKIALDSSPDPKAQSLKKGTRIKPDRRVQGGIHTTLSPTPMQI
jgi:hypothetical protein